MTFMYLVGDFRANVSYEMIISWVESTRKHQVLPYHQSQPISQCIELSGLIHLDIVHMPINDTTVKNCSLYTS